jgi:putative tryptophan/tyrosine transport system substrate-binding protein
MGFSRRHFAGLSVALVVAPDAVYAQRPAGAARVGVLETGSPAAFPERMEAFRRGLAEFAPADAQAVVLEYRWAHGKTANLPALAAELVDLKVDLIFAGTTVAALAATQASSTVPIVYAVAADPVGVGLAATLARPGGKATGLTSANVDITPKRLQLLTEVAGGKVSRLAILFYPGDASNVLAARAAQEAARSLGLSLRPLPVNRAQDFEAAFSALDKDRVDALMVAAGALTDSHAGQLADLAARFRVPAIYGARGFVEAGGLVSYSADFSDNYRRAAAYVHKILRGAAPGDLPVEQSSRFELALNLRTARQLGLNIARSFRLRADFVIE